MIMYAKRSRDTLTWDCKYAKPPFFSLFTIIISLNVFAFLFVKEQIIESAFFATLFMNNEKMTDYRKRKSTFYESKQTNKRTKTFINQKKTRAHVYGCLRLVPSNLSSNVTKNDRQKETKKTDKRRKNESSRWTILSLTLYSLRF